MGRLIKTFPDGHIALAHNFVHAPGYSLFVADYSVPGHVHDGWYYEADDIEHEDLAQPWVQPTGSANAYALGDIVSHNGSRWRSTIVGNVWEPGVSGWANVDSDLPAWLQPTGAHDAYVIGAMVRHNGSVWKSLLDANVWEPGVTGWRKAAVVPPSGVVPLPDWVQPLGAQDAYQLGAQVRHNNKNWESTIGNNVWEPGVYGWIEIT
jgi:hypothetical protein